MKQYNVGDVVWIADMGNKQVEKVCTVCFGKKKVNLILGNDEIVEMPCEYCNDIMTGPRGYNLEYEYVVAAKQVKISKVKASYTENGNEFEYMYDECYIIRDVFETKEDAEKKCEEYVKEYTEDQYNRSNHNKKSAMKKASWNAGYYTRCANNALKILDYHQSKAKIIKENS